jgi:hypothetical protein
MVHEIPDYYIDRIVKNFGRDWTSIVKGISEVEIRISVYRRAEIDQESIE